MSRKLRIQQLITQELAPMHLEVEDESNRHHVPEGAETHFKVTVVCEQFMNLTRIGRHRLLNQLLNAEFAQGLHALSMHLYTTDEWKAKEGNVLESPKCKNGHDK